MLATEMGRLISLTTVSGPAHDLPGGDAIWRSWPFEPLMLLPVVLMGVWYAAGLRSWPERSREHPRWRTMLFYLGLATMVLAVNSPLHMLSERHFSMHMVQHMLLVMLAAPLVLLGAPTTPVLRGMPRWLRLGVVRPLSADRLARGAFRLLVHPLVALVTFTAALWAWHLAPGWYEAATTDEGIHRLQHMTFVVTAFQFWWSVIDPAPLHSSLGYLMRMVYLVVQGTAQSILGAFITLVDRPLYEHYVQATPILSISPMSDQQLGGLIMWVAPGSMVNLAAIGVLFATWYVQGERRQRELDAERDAAESAHARQGTY
jgi:putative membrane protein